MLIRKIEPADIRWVTQSIGNENWGYLENDVKGCFDLEPNGCFIAEVDSQRVGHAFSLCYENFSWISFVIVSPGYRHRGIAMSMLKKIISYLEILESNPTHLEAVPGISNLYRKLGFQDQFNSLRMVTQSIHPVKLVNEHIQPIENRDLDGLINFDRNYFGSSREKVIKRMLKDYPKHCFLFKDNDNIQGYIMARKTPRGYWIGPLTANPDRPQAVKSLINVVADSFKKGFSEIKIGVPEVNQSAVKILSELGFSTVSHSIRMVRGTVQHKNNMNGIFGIGGPEKG